jgi:hypothetical protein
LIANRDGGDRNQPGGPYLPSVLENDLAYRVCQFPESRYLVVVLTRAGCDVESW